MEQDKQHKPDVVVRLPHYIPDEYAASLKTNEGFSLDVGFPAKRAIYNQVQDPSLYVDAIIYIQSHYVEILVNTSAGVVAAALSKWLGTSIRTIFSWQKWNLTSQGATEIKSNRKIEVVIPWKEKSVSAIFEGETSDAMVEKMTDKLIAYIERNQLPETEKPDLPEPTDMPMKLSKPRVRIRYNPEIDSYEIVMK